MKSYSSLHCAKPALSSVMLPISLTTVWTGAREERWMTEDPLVANWVLYTYI